MSAETDSLDLKPINIKQVPKKCPRQIFFPFPKLPVQTFQILDDTEDELKDNFTFKLGREVLIEQHTQIPSRPSFSAKEHEYESPIRSTKASQVLSAYYAKQIQNQKKILEFKKKKVINSNDKKYLELLESHNYTYNEKEKLYKLRGSVPIRSLIESRVSRIIKKSAVAKKVVSFWRIKGTHFPSVFKKVFVPDENNLVVEWHDLSCHLIGTTQNFEDHFLSLKDGSSFK